MKQPRRSFGLDKFRIKTKEITFERIKDIEVDKIYSDFFRKYSYETKFNYHKYLLIIRYKETINYVTCILTNTETGKEIIFTSRKSIYFIIDNIRELIAKLDKHYKELQESQALRIRAYENSQIR